MTSTSATLPLRTRIDTIMTFDVEWEQQVLRDIFSETVTVYTVLISTVCCLAICMPECESSPMS